MLKPPPPGQSQLALPALRAPVTPAVLEALRAIVGDKGLIADDQGKQPFVTDWRGAIVGGILNPSSSP